MNSCLNEVIVFYDHGFKCIKYEHNSDGSLVIYLKNFENEKAHTLCCNDKKEIKKIKDYIDLN